MGEFLPKLGGEEEARIYSCYLAAPEFGQLGLDGSVERCVDFSGIEKAGEIFKGMLFAKLHSRRIENAIPVFIGPACGAEADVMRKSLGQADLC